MSLLDLQRDFGAWLREAPVAVEDHVGTDNAAGLAVYRHAYRAQLTACLRETYERTHAWLGDEAFDDVARRYIDAHAPCAWTLGDYGHAFETMLAGLYPDDAEVAELAWLDWTLRRAFEAADALALDVDSLSGVDWDNALFQFVPTLRLRIVTSNAVAIWRALAADTTPPAAMTLPVAVTVRAWRKAFSTQFRSMEADEATALRLALDGCTFGEICAELVKDGDAAVAGSVLARWLEDGLLTSIDD